MPSNSDYRKPRHKELQDLVWSLPHPVRVKDPEGRLLWQNRQAEQCLEEDGWTTGSGTWQNKKAVFESRVEGDTSNLQARQAELEDEIARLKKQQRQTARKKRQAEDSVKKHEKSVDSSEKKLRQEIARLEKELGKLPAQKEKLEADNKKLKQDLKELKAASKQAEKEQADSAQLKEVKQELKRAREEAERRLEDVEQRREENAKQAELLFKARARISELEEQAAAAPAEPSPEVGKLEEDKRALETWVEELEAERDKAQAQVKVLEQALSELEQAFRDFKQEVENDRTERELEAQLAEKVAELEALEKTLESEQRSFEEEKAELRHRLDSQEQETRSLREGIAASAEEASDEERELAVLKLEVAETKEELEDLKTELHLSQRKEKRLTEKLSTMESLREEHAKVLDLLKEDLAESRQREKELKEQVRSGSGSVAGYSPRPDNTEELNSLREEAARLKEKVRELESRPAAAPAPGDSGEPLSLPVKNQIDFLKSRLAGTEKELDEARVKLQQEKAQNQSSKEAERLAFQDSLTGLPNRNMVDRYLDFAHQRARQSGRTVGLFLIDVSGFRLLNKTHGSKWGDRLLKSVGERLNSMRGSSHLVGRMGRDQFLLLAADIDRANQAQFVQDASRSLLEAVAYPFELDGDQVNLTGSVGVSFGPLEGDSSRGLYEQAETALEQAKQMGTSKFALYDEKLKQMKQREATYATQMAHALEKNEFKTVFQPVFNLHKGIVLGLELLLRWEHRDLRVLEPAEFLEPAIKSGLIFQITEKVWPQAFREFAKWRKMRPGLTLSINLSDRELLSPSVLKRAVQLAKDNQIDPRTIIFEVRDQSRLRMSSTWWRVLQDYTSAGFGLCLDDFAADASLFGTLAYTGFVQAKMSVFDERNIQFVAAPQASKNLLYGVKRLQTKFDKKALAKMGFHLAQGYAVSRPLDYADVDMVLS